MYIIVVAPSRKYSAAVSANRSECDYLVLLVTIETNIGYYCKAGHPCILLDDEFCKCVAL